MVAALPFPLAQGSQIYVAGQALALARAGAEVTVFCYGHGDAEDDTSPVSPTALREAGVAFRRAPGLFSRTPLRAGPSLGKPLADAALLASLASEARRGRFDVVLAHNAEAGAIALSARPLLGAPVVYVAHTLLHRELASYLPAPAERLAAAAGERIDAWLAGSSDAVITVSRAAQSELSALARGRAVWIPPALDAGPVPSCDEIAAACGRAGLPVNGFVLYAGNLDAYQELDLLAKAARLLARERGRTAPPIVVVTHDHERRAPAPLRLVRVRSYAEARTLGFAASLAVLARRSPGGSPIKLLNYMEAGRAIVAFAGVSEGLLHGREAWLVPPKAGAAGLARTLGQLASMPAVAAQLGGAARRRLERMHSTRDLAERTLAFLALVRERGAHPGGDA